MKKILWYLRINGIIPVIKILLTESRMFLETMTFRKLTNLIRGMYNLYLCKSIIKTSPFKYYIEPTNNCNLRCPFCLTTRQSSRSKGYLSTDLYKQIISDISPYAIVINLYLRGESFLHEDITEMISYAKQKKISVKIDTNMHMMNKDIAKKIVEAKLDRLIIEIDGADQETYSKYRVRGTLKKVIDNMKLLRAIRNKYKSRYPVLEVRTIIMKYNENQLDQIKKLAYENGADNIFFVPMMMDAVNDEAYYKWSPSDQYKSLYDPVTRKNKFSSNHNKCAELWTFGIIQYDGTVIPCCLDDEGKGFGKIDKNRNFRQIWNSKDFIAARKAVCGYKTDIINDCTRCRGRMKNL